MQKCARRQHPGRPRQRGATSRPVPRPRLYLPPVSSRCCGRFRQEIGRNFRYFHATLAQYLESNCLSVGYNGEVAVAIAVDLDARLGLFKQALEAILPVAEGPDAVDGDDNVWILHELS